MTRSFSSLSIRELLTTHERKEKKSVQRMIRSNTTELGFLRCHQVDVSATNTCTDTVVSVVDTQKGSAYESEILFRSTGAESVVLKSQTSIACLSIAASCSTKSIGMYFYRRWVLSLFETIILRLLFLYFQGRIQTMWKLWFHKVKLSNFHTIGNIIGKLGKFPGNYQ